MDDRITLLAKQRIVKLSAELEVQLSAKPGSAPALEILYRMRDRAAELLAALAFINLCDPAEIVKAITLQNEVKRYDEWITWMSQIVQEGVAYDKELSAGEREELVDYLTQTPQGRRQAEQLGLIDPGGDDD